MVSILLGYTVFFFLNFHFEWVKMNIHSDTCHPDRYGSYSPREYPSFYTIYATIFVTFVLPAVVSFALYIAVFTVLMKKRRNVARNRTLSIAFFSSLVAWVVLGVPYYANPVMDLIIRTYNIIWLYGSHNPVGSVLFFTWTGSGTAAFLSLYAVLNPIILITVCRPFRAATWNLFSAIGNLCFKKD